MILSLALALVASPLLPEAQAVFPGCHTEPSGGGRFTICADWTAGIMPFTSDAAPMKHEAEMGLIRVGLERTLGARFHEEEFALTLEGRHSPGLRGVPLEASTIGLAMALIDRSPHGTHFLICVAETDGDAQRSRCVRAFEYFATKGSPDGVAVDGKAPDTAPAILSHRMPVPEGCRIAANEGGVGRIQCKSSMVSWTILPHNPKNGSNLQWLAAVIPVVSSTLGGGAAETRPACRVEGADAICARLVKNAPGGPSTTVWIGVTSLQDQDVMVTCANSIRASAAGTPGFAAVCDGSIASP